MTFLNPLLLAGLAGIAVPILIHLLNRQRVQRIPWAAMRFLRVSLERNQRRLRLEDLLLLLLRGLLILLIALALARPVFQSADAVGLGRAAITGVIVLDNSASMRATDGVQSRFARARAYAETIVDTLPESSALAVLVASDVVRGLIPEPSRDLNLVRKVLRDAPLSDRATHLLPALRQAVDTLERRGGARREIYVITDGQALGWQDLPEIVRWLQEHRVTLHANFIFIRDPERHNLAVTGLRLASGLTPVEQALRFEVQVTNAGDQDAVDVPVRLRVNAEPPSDQAVMDRLPARTTRSVSLFARLPAEGPHTVTAEVPGDRVPGDDQRVLAVTATRRLRLLLVDGRLARDARDRETFYLRQALTPVEAAAAADYFIEPVVVSSADLETTRLDDYAAVLLANVADFSQSTAAGLEQYVKRGGGLVVFPGAAVNPRFYNDELFARYGFLPARLGSLREAPEAESAWRWQAKDYAHPITALWNDPAAGTLASARFQKAYALEPATNAAVVVRFTDGQPGIVERAWGQGRVVLWASTASTAWNDLPVRPAWVPLLYRMLGALQQQKQAALTIPVGDRFFYRMPEETLHQDAFIQFGGEPRQLARVDLVDGRPALTTEEVDRAGAYSVTVVSEPPVRLQFAAQPDPRESAVDVLTDAELAQLANVAHVVTWQAEASWKQTVRQDGGREIWRALLWAALAVAVVETILGQRFSEPK
jgi:hypothetical protein